MGWRLTAKGCSFKALVCISPSAPNAVLLCRKQHHANRSPVLRHFGSRPLNGLFQRLGSADAIANPVDRIFEIAKRNVANLGRQLNDL
jgi:hypothetical protein